LNKAEVNITTAGNILRADGTLFKSISEVEFLRNKDAYRRAPDSKFFDNKQLIAWDNFDRPNENSVVQSDSGHAYLPFRSANVGEINNLRYVGNSSSVVERAAIITVNPTKNIGLEFSFARTTFADSSAGIFFVKDNLNYLFFGRILNSSTILSEIPLSNNYQLIAVISGVATVLGTISLSSIYISGPGIDDSFTNCRMNFVIKYLNRGRNNSSSLLVQSLDAPNAMLQVFVNTYNSVFATPTDYNRIGIIATRSSPILSYKVANLDL
jgi:hypothetical protein